MREVSYKITITEFTYILRTVCEYLRKVRINLER